MRKLLNKPYDLTGAPTLQHFFTDLYTPVVGVMSHVNTGKTTAMVLKSQYIAANQHPNANGVRETAHIFIRGTHADLLRGVVRTFEKWISPELVTIRKSPPVTGKMIMQPLGDQNKPFPEFAFINGKRVPYKLGGWDSEKEDYLPGAEDVSGVRIGDVFSQGTYVNAMFDFVALDNPDWEASLLGTEYTCAYLDEPDSMSNISEVLTKIPGRLGRYPDAMTAPISVTQIAMSYNPPPEKSFTEEFFAKKNEHLGRKLYRVQPPFLLIPDKDEPSNFFKAEFVRNPEAEGIRFAPKGFRHWQEIIDANRHDPNKIRRDVLGQYTKGSGGELVHTAYNPDVHKVSSIQPDRSRKLFCSCDWGNSGAALFAQFKEGGLRVIEELSADGVMSHEFVKRVVIPHLNTEYRGFDIVITGDPSGAYKRDVGEGPFTIFEDYGFIVEDDMDNDPQARWTAVNNFLKIQDGLKISEHCVELVRGFEGLYVYKTQRDGQKLLQVDKRKHHTAYQDCLQALCQLVDGGYETASSSVLGSGRYDRQEDDDDSEGFLWV